MDEAKKLFDSKYTGLQIEEAIAAGLELQSDPQLALFNLGARPNRNLLDNWYFVGGGSQSGYGNFPINQKGKQLYDQADATCIDRHYKSSNAVVELLDDCLKISLYASESLNRFAHKFSTSFVAGTTYTVSLLLKSLSNTCRIYIQEDGGDFTTPIAELISEDGLFSRTFTCTKSGMYQILLATFNPYDTVIQLIAGKMEIGSAQTLAYQKDGKWNLLETPDYSAELERCQRYLIIETAENEKPGTVYSSTSGVFTISTAVQMRTTPVLAELKGYEPKIALSDGSTVLITKEEITVLGADVSGVRVRVDVTGGKTLKLGPASIRDCNMVLSAEL